VAQPQLLRERIYTALWTDGDWPNLVPGELWQYSSFDQVPETKPFAVIRWDFGQSGIVHRGIGSTKAFSIWAHDIPGDYVRIDQILDRAQQILEALLNEDDFLECRRLDTSPDLEDPEMGTILRYSRFGVVTTS
jgi:hypothetical protein